MEPVVNPPLAPPNPRLPYYDGARFEARRWAEDWLRRLDQATRAMTGRR
jgi:hypothetical protein